MKSSLAERPSKCPPPDKASCSMEGFSARAVEGLTPAKLAENTSFTSAHSPEPFLSPSPPLHKKLPTGLAARGDLFFCYLSFSSGDDSVWGKGRPPARPAVPWKSFSPERLGRSPHRQRRRPQAPFGLDKQTTVLNSSNLYRTERGVSPLPAYKTFSRAHMWPARTVSVISLFHPAAILSGGRGRPPVRPAVPWRGFPPGRWGRSPHRQRRRTPSPWAAPGSWRGC